MIEIRRDLKRKNGFDCVVNGERLKDCSISYRQASDDYDASKRIPVRFEVSTQSVENMHKFSELRWAEVKPVISEFTLSESKPSYVIDLKTTEPREFYVKVAKFIIIPIKFTSEEESVIITRIAVNDDGEYKDQEAGDNELEYCIYFRREALLKGFACNINSADSTVTLVQSLVADEDRTIAEDIESIEKAIEVFDLAARGALTQPIGESVNVRFQFPEAVQVTCEQYLLYFAQFLKDVGVSATANLKHEASSVLFTVTPSDPHEALDKIRAALDLYLNLPTASSSSFMPPFNAPMEVQMLAITVRQLQDKLVLANMIVRQQEATIQAQETTIGVLRERQASNEITPQVFVDSVKEVVKSGKMDDKDKQSILWGLGEIAKYEGKGFNINLAEMYRRIAKLFGKDDVPLP